MCARHRDADFVSWMKCSFPHMIFLFVPANLIEMCQPLDRCFNSLMKSLLRALQNVQNVEHVFDLLQSEGGAY